jgi:hypothetical protein
MGANRIAKRFKLFFLAIWVFTLFIPYIRTVYPEVLGEAFWNKFSAVHYFSGYMGYLLLGHYIKDHVRHIQSSNRYYRAFAGYHWLCYHPPCISPTSCHSLKTFPNWNFLGRFVPLM